MIVGVCFTYHLTFKTVKEGKTLGPHWILGISSNTKLCILTVLREYLHRTKDVGKGQRQLLLSYQKPHHPIRKKHSCPVGERHSPESRWGHSAFQCTQHSICLHFCSSLQRITHWCHHESCWLVRGLPIDVIMKAAGWSAASTFTWFYEKTPVLNLGQILLDAYRQKKWCKYNLKQLGLSNVH